MMEMKLFFVLLFSGLKVIAAADSYLNQQLFDAAIAGHTNTARLLIEKGADVRAKQVNKITPLHVTAKYGHTDLAKLLIENGAKVDAKDEQKETSLHKAAKYGQTVIAKLLIEQRADVEAKQVNKFRPLHVAAKYGHTDLAKLLIESGAKVDAKDEYKGTSLHQAAQYGQTVIARILIEKGAKVDAETKQKWTPLHVAAKYGQTVIARLLIEKGAKVDAQTKQKWTPLQLATQEGHTDLVNFLKGDSRNLSRLTYVSATKVACIKYSRPQETPIFLTPRILDGKKVERGEFPWMAGLFYTSSDGLENTLGCGGTIISEYFILTAAHCIKEYRRPTLVRVGKLTIDKDDGLPGKIYHIKNITKHPGYSMLKGINDIALIETSKHIEFTDDVAAACLHTEMKDVNSELIVIGWGATDPDNTSNCSNWLLKTNLTTKPLSECNSFILDWNKDKDLPQYRNGISEGQYCAYDPEGKKDSCQGDSGGPLQYFHNSSSSTATIVGIVSFGLSCGTTLPSIYTRVAYYIHWIESIVWPREVIHNL